MNKNNKHKEREFEKDESDYLKEKLEREKREDHMRIYGVPTFESSSEEEEAPKKPLDEINEEEEEEIDSETELPKKKSAIVADDDDLKISFGDGEADTESSKKKPSKKKKSTMAGKNTPEDVKDPSKETLKPDEKKTQLIAPPGVVILDEDMERLRKIREERERDNRERELQKKKLAELAEKQRLELEEKLKKKEKFKPKKKK